LDVKIRTSLIFNPNLTTIELLQAINQDFGIRFKSQSKRELVDDLNQLLLSELPRQGNAVLIVDEAQNLTVDCLEEIRLLSNLETPKEKLLQIVLVGQPELREKLSLRELRQVNQRVSLRYHLDPLDLKETENYIDYRLEVAGGRKRTTLFTTKAIEKIHRLTYGIPRMINILCDKSLLAAYVAGSKEVSDTLVDKAQMELEGKLSNGRPVPLMRLSNFDRSMILSIAWKTGTVICLLVFGLALWKWKAPAAPIFTPPVSDAQVHAVSEPATPVPVRSDFGIDYDGVFRVSDPNQAKLAAYLTLLSQWGIEPEIEKGDFSDLVLDSFIQHSGLRPYAIFPDWQKLQFLDYPAVIRIGSGSADPPHEAVLIGLSAEKALVLDPLHGKLSFSRKELESRWSDPAIILWRELNGISLPISEKDSGTESVQNLQRVLKAQGFYSDEVNGSFGPSTVLAVKFFQQKMGLKDDGMFNLESYLVLAKITQPIGVPSLRLINAE
jgi:general secretion pathway protein A